MAGHCNYGGISLAYEWFTPYAFHLGLFVFASGYFYKDSSEKNIKGYIWRKIKKLIIPMYIWNVIYALFVQLTRIKGFTIGNDINYKNLFVEPLINGHQFVYNMGLWFVVPLFVIETFNILLRKGIKTFSDILNEYIIACLYFALGLFGVYIAYKGYNKGINLLIVRVLYLLPFYGLGTLYNRKLERKDKLNNTLYFSIIFIIQLLLITIFNGVVRYHPSWCNDFTSNIVLPYIVGVLGIAFWLRIARIIEPITKKSRILNLIADNTYSIMIHQFLGFFVIKTIFALLSKSIVLFKDFNWIKYKTDIWYYYLPKHINQWLILYLIAGIFIPIMINKILEKVRKINYQKFLLLNKRQQFERQNDKM